MSPEPASFADAAPATRAPQGTTTTAPTAPYDAEAHIGALAQALYGQQPPPGAREALRRLNRLRAGVPALRGGQLNLDALVRHVLMQAPNTPVTMDDRRELMRVAMDPAMVDARGLARLSALYLKLKGALSDEFRFTTSGGAQGLNWTGAPLAPQLDLAGVTEYARQPDGRRIPVKQPGPAPWGTGPYTVVADGTALTVKVRGAGGFHRDAPKAVVAELLGLDDVLSALPGDVPVLMAISMAATISLALSQDCADLLSRKVWASSGLVVLGRVIGIDVSQERAFAGGRLLSEPDPTPRNDHEGEDWERHVVSMPFIGPDHRSAGHMSVPLNEPAESLRSKTRTLLDLPTATHFVHYDVATGAVSGPQPLPWVAAQEPTPYFEAKHGNPGSSLWALTDTGAGRMGILPTRGQRTSGALKRRRSLHRRSGKSPIVRFVCYSGLPEGLGFIGEFGPPPYVPDPLAVVSEAQRVATDNDRPVYAFLRKAYGNIMVPGGEFLGAATDVRGRAYAPEVRMPEPTGAALQTRARDGGLHTGPGPLPQEARVRTERLVRLLRHWFGDRIDWAPEYPVLWRGVGALDAMLRNDPRLDRVPLFTVELFTYLVAGFQAQQPADARLTGKALGEAMLKRAGERWAQDPRPALTDFVPLPVVTAVAATMAHPAFDALTAHTLGLNPGQVGDAERSRMLWAEVKVQEALSLMRQQGGEQELDTVAVTLLHLPTPDPARRAELTQLLRKAAAHGRDLGRLREVAEFHLESRGALAPATFITTTGGAAIGRDHTGNPAGTIDFDPAQVTLLRRQPDGTLVPDATVQAPWYDPRKPDAPSPWLFRADQRGGRAVIGVPVQHPEIGELSYRDPAMGHLPPDVPVIMLIEGARPAPGQPAVASLPGQNALWAGRTTYAAYGKPTLYTDPATGKTTVALEPDASGRTRAVTDLGVVRPGDVRGAFGAPEPNPPALAATAPAPLNAQAPAPTAPAPPA